MNKRYASVALVAAMTLAGYAKAAPSEATLKVGDPAPALAGGKWLKGDPIEKFDAGKIYVVEFWATWCGPCKAAIPHVTEMQKTYAKDGVTFIGQNVWERDQSLPEPFVKQMGDKMDYHVRMDAIPEGGEANDGTMATTWMQAAGQNGIPCSFLIGKDGKVAWIGHPMELEPVLKEVIAGTFDPAKTAAAAEAKQKDMKELSAALKAKDYDGALAKLDSMAKANPDNAEQFTSIRFQILLRKKDYPAAQAIAQKTLESGTDEKSAQPMAMMAYGLTGTKDKDNLALAEKLAGKAVDLTQHKDFQALYVQASVYYAEGLTDKATAAKEETLAAAPEEAKGQLTQEFARMATPPTTKPAS